MDCLLAEQSDSEEIAVVWSRIPQACQWKAVNQRILVVRFVEDNVGHAREVGRICAVSGLKDVVGE